MESQNDQESLPGSDIVSSAKCRMKKDQVLPEDWGFRFRNAADGDELRNSDSELLYGRPVSSHAGAEVHEPCWICELRERIRREDSGSGLGMKWGAKKMRSIPLRKRNLGFFPYRQQVVPPVASPDSEISPCLPEMIGAESIPTVAQMETCPPSLQSPVLGPESPVPTQKISKKRKSDTAQTRLCCQEEEIPTSPPKFWSSISSESRGQPAAQSSKRQPDDYQVEGPGAKGGHTEGLEDYRNTILDISPLMKAVEEFGIPCGEEQVYSRQVIAQGNQGFRQLEGSSPGTAGSAEDSHIHTPFGLKFSITKKGSSGQKQRFCTEVDENVWTPPEESEDAALWEDPDFLPGVRSRWSKAKKKLSVDLNEPADKDDSEFLLEAESPEASLKKRVRKHSRPRVVKDVTKPVRVPKSKKAGSTKPRNSTTETTKRSTNAQRTKKAQSQAAEATKEVNIKEYHRHDERESSRAVFPRRREDAADYDYVRSSGSFGVSGGSSPPAPLDLAIIPVICYCALCKGMVSKRASEAEKDVMKYGRHVEEESSRAPLDLAIIPVICYCARCKGTVTKRAGEAEKDVMKYGRHVEESSCRATSRRRRREASSRSRFLDRTFAAIRTKMELIVQRLSTPAADARRVDPHAFRQLLRRLGLGGSASVPACGDQGHS